MLNLSADEINNNYESQIKLILSGESYGTKNEKALTVYNKGLKALDANDLKTAQNNFLEAIKIDPLFVDAIDYLGITYRRLGEYEKAEKEYLKSIDINPKNFVPYANLALIYLFQKKFEESIQMYSQMIELDSENPESYYGIGIVYSNMEEYELSVKYINKAIEKYEAAKSDYVYDAYFAQGENYYIIGDDIKALKYYKKALKANPQNSYLLNMIKGLEKSN
jgi:tetratricopeptide (TPR) repeat protein